MVLTKETQILFLRRIRQIMSFGYDYLNEDVSYFCQRQVQNYMYI